MLSLKAFLGLDASGFEAGIKRAQSAADKFSKSIGHEMRSQLGNFLGAAAVEEAIRKTIEYGGTLADTATKLGISTDAVQEWDYALRLSGATMEQGAAFFQKLATSREEALSGNEHSIESFRRLGVTLEDLRSMRLEDLGLKIANAIKSGDVQKLIASLKDVGGKGAGEMAAAFKNGMQEAFDEARALGIVWNKETVKKIDAIGDSFTTLGERIMGALAPVITWITDKFKFIIDLVEASGARMGAFAAIMESKGIKAAFNGEAFEAGQKAVEDLEKAKAQADSRAPAKPNIGNGGGGEGRKEEIGNEFLKTGGHGSGASGFNANSLQQIGAMISGSQMQSALTQNTQEIRANTAALRKAHYVPSERQFLSIGNMGGKDIEY